MENTTGTAKIWNLPNRITLGRLVLSGVLFLALALMQANVLKHDGPFAWVAFGLFIVAAGTDWLDGYLARKHGLVTVFGRIMDPFVDKVVVCGALVFLCSPGGTGAGPHVWIDAWMVVVVIGREFFVSAVRGFAESKGINFQADMPGKVKMVIQCLAIGAILLFRCLDGAGPAWAGDALGFLIPILVWLTLASTLQSGWYYGRKALLHLREFGG